MIFPLVLLLVSSLPLVKCQTDNIRPPDVIYEEVCEKINEIKNDFSRYLQLYKQLAEQLLEESPGTNECREELNRMFEIIKCLMDLANEMERLKFLVQEDSDKFRQHLQDWLILVQEKQMELVRIANFLRDKDSVSDENITEFDRLNVGCIDQIQGGLIDILENEVMRAVALAQNGIKLIWNPPVPEICAKARKMKLLCQSMMLRFKLIRLELKKKGFKVPIFPHEEMADLCRCIIEFCRCVDDLIRLCRNANNMTPAAIEKRLCEILMKIKEIRNDIVDYWGALAKKTQKLAKLISKDKDFIKEVKKFFKNNPFLDLIMEMDDCILWLECIYMDIVTGKTLLSRAV